MKKVQIIVVLTCLLFSLMAGAENTEPAKAEKQIEPLPRDVEIQLALSSLPPHLRDNATVYVLNPDKGFEVARNGTNGFHAFVARTGDDAFRGAWLDRETPVIDVEAENPFFYEKRARLTFADLLSEVEKAYKDIADFAEG